MVIKDLTFALGGCMVAWLLQTLRYEINRKESSLVYVLRSMVEAI